MKLLLITMLLSLNSFAYDYVNSDVDTNKYCVEFMDEKDVDCSLHVYIDDVPQADCNIEIELKDKKTDEIKFHTIKSHAEADGGAGVFNMLLIGLVIDGPIAVAQRVKAKSLINRELKKLSRFRCDQQ